MGFIKNFVDRVSGYSDEYEDEYEDEQYDDRQESNPQFGGNDSQYNEDIGYTPQPPAQEHYRQPAAYPRQEPSYQQQDQFTYNDHYRTEAPPMAPPISSKVVPLKSLSDRQLVFLQPDSIKSAQLVCDHLRNGHAVICNIENVDAKIAQRVIDFISGAAFALDGKVKPIDSKAHNFVAAPKGVSLIDDKQQDSGRRAPERDQGQYRNQQYM